MYISIIFVVLIAIYYISEFVLTRRYGRLQHAAGSARSWSNTLLAIVLGAALVVQPIVLPWLGWTAPAWLTGIGILLVAMALTTRVWARVSLARASTEREDDPDGHYLVETGPYRYLRHPLYASYILLVVGLLLVNPSIPTLLVAFYAFYKVLSATRREEALLAPRMAGYRDYMARVPQFVPRPGFVRDAARSLDSLMNVPTDDPDDQRRRRVLNAMLLMLVGAILIGEIATVYYTAAGLQGQNEAARLYTAGLIAFTTMLLVFWLNRRRSRWAGMAASWIFLLVLAAVIAIDEPREVVGGRSLGVFYIPVIMASLILPPVSSFGMAILISVLVFSISAISGEPPNLVVMLGFYIVAFVSWLSSRSIERALRELRIINRELDQRVADRTRDLQAESSKNQAILQSIADGVIVFDNHGRAVLANPAISELLGSPIADIAGRRLQQLMDGTVSRSMREKVLSLLDGSDAHKSMSVEWGSKTLSVNVAPWRVGGEVSGTVAVFRDFTQEARIDRMKSTFVSIASHELKTPLNAVLGIVEMLQNRIYGPLSDGQQGALNRVAYNIARLVSLARNLLDQAQIQSGNLTLEIKPFQIADLLKEAENLLEVEASAKGLQLTMEIEAGVPGVLEGDQQRLLQIIMNLVSNGIKYTDAGTVSLRVFVPRPDRWGLEVSDTGHGIPPHAQGYVFDAFRQVDMSAAREKGGVGLGLAIVKELVTLMGGEIRLASNVGQGSTFTVTLPKKITKHQPLEERHVTSISY